MSTNGDVSSPQRKQPKICTTKLSPMQEFDAVFPDLVERIASNGKTHPELQDAIEWFRQVIIGKY